MKTRFIMLLLALLGCSTIMAQGTPLAEGEVFTIKNGGNDIWLYTATTTGTVKIVGDNGDGDWIGSCLVVYDDASMKHEIQNYNWVCYEFPATAGHTYYIKNWNNTGQDFRGKIQAGSEPLALVSTDPAEGQPFPFVGDTEATLHFNTSSVTFSRGQLTCNGNTIHIYNYNDWNQLIQEGIITYTEEGTSGLADYNGNVLGHIDNFGNIVIPFTSATGKGYRNVLLELLEEGKIATGMEMTLELYDVCNSLTGEKLDGEGYLRLQWLVGDLPTRLLSESIPATLLSWFAPGTADAVATFTFTHGIQSASASLTMGYADAEDLYYEDIASDHIHIEGNTVKVDFSGKLRTLATMGLQNNWGSFTLTLSQVRDTDGHPTFSGDQGSASSYNYMLGYQDISVTISSEFEPASGSQLTAEHKEVEIWFNNSDMIDFDGVTLQYSSSVFVPRSQLHVTQDTDGMTVICPLPEDIHQHQNIHVILHITAARDGQQHSIEAIYNPSGNGLSATAIQLNAAPAFNLQGQRAVPGQRGIVIRDGRKMLTK